MKNISQNFKRSYLGPESISQMDEEGIPDKENNTNISFPINYSLQQESNR
jgi:hypothetical protein